MEEEMTEVKVCANPPGDRGKQPLKDGKESGRVGGTCL